MGGFKAALPPQQQSTNLFALVDDFVLDTIFELAAAQTPANRWAGLATVSRAFAASARRVLPRLWQSLGASAHFSRALTHPRIDVANSTRGCVLTKTGTRGDYTWAVSNGTPLGMRRVHRLRATHTKRVQGGGFFGVFVTDARLPDADDGSNSGWEFYPPSSSSLGFVRKHLGAKTATTAFAVLGTVSGDVVRWTKGMSAPDVKTTRRLNGESGDKFEMEYDVAENELRMTMNGEFVHTCQLFSVGPQELPTLMLHWCLTLFAVETVFTLEPF